MSYTSENVIKMQELGLMDELDIDYDAPEVMVDVDEFLTETEEKGEGND